MRIVFRISATADVRLYHERTERTQEHVRVAPVLLEEILGACLDELIQIEVTVVVGVYRLEVVLGERRVQPDDLQVLIVVALAHQIVIVHALNAMWKSTRVYAEVHLHVVVNLRHLQLRNPVHELLPRDCGGVAAAQHAHVLVSHLQMIYDHQRQLRQECVQPPGNSLGGKLSRASRT